MARSAVIDDQPRVDGEKLPARNKANERCRNRRARQAEAGRGQRQRQADRKDRQHEAFEPRLREEPAAARAEGEAHGVSCARSEPRARRRFAMFAHATNSSKPAAACQITMKPPAPGSAMPLVKRQNVGVAVAIGIRVVTPLPVDDRGQFGASGIEAFAAGEAGDRREVVGAPILPGRGRQRQRRPHFRTKRNLEALRCHANDFERLAIKPHDDPTMSARDPKRRTHRSCPSTTRRFCPGSASSA